MKKKIMNIGQKMDLREQARMSRDAEWEAAHLEIEADLEAGSISPEAYHMWLEENIRPSDIITDQAAERKRLKRKSKKNITSNLVIVDRVALRHVRMKETKIEWGKGLEEGALVETRDGDIGIVMSQYDPTHNRVRKPKHIEAAMVGSYVRLLVKGIEEWHTKLSVSPMEDG